MNVQLFFVYLTDGLASTLYVFGAITFLIAGPLVDTHGPTVTSVFSLILTVPSHLGLWLLTNNHFDHDKYLIYVLFLMGGEVCACIQ